MSGTGFFASLFMAFFVAFVLECELLAARYLVRTQSPRPLGQAPYTWGYFFGINGMVSAALIILALSIVPEISILFRFFASLVVVLVWGIPGYFVIQRKKWGWVILTLMSVNPIVWVINYAYGKNR
ncbi:MAG: hypothetical protein OEV30_06125 [Ignavibacteria bacterium]|nr:hypothetical protein [Ignavibacteria bacterium]